MLRLPAFDYVAPASVDAAVAVLAEHGAAAMLLAGGTDLVPNLKRLQVQPRVLVGLRGIRELRGIRPAPGGGLVIGALTTLSEVADHPDIQRDYPALAQAAAAVATLQIRNSGTLGGNLCLDTRCNYYNQTQDWREALGYCLKCQGSVCRVATSSPKCVATSSSDTAPVAVALGATVRLAGPRGRREMAAAGLYQDDGQFYLTRAADEILTEVVLPPANGLRSVYLKVRRRGAFDFPILGVAAAGRLDGQTVQDMQVVLGAAGSQPVAVTEAGNLAGGALTEDAIQAVARAAYRRAKPMDNTDLSITYRKRMAQVYTARALRALA